jgi:hypothetical protein
MFGAWNRVCSADAKAGYWKGCEHMSISDFSRSCEKAIEQLVEVPDMQLPHVGALWNIKRSLRAKPPAPTGKPDDADVWEISGNRHLFAYLQKNPKRYHPDSGFRDGQAIPGSEGTHRTLLLVKAKNEWVQCMREEAVDGAVDVETQRGMWKHFMTIAEEQIGA